MTGGPALRPHVAQARTPRLRGLGAVFEVRTPLLELGPWLEATFAALVDHEPASRHAVVYELQSEGPGYALYADGRQLARTRTLSRSVQLLLWHINRLVVRESGDWLLLHAAAAQRHGLRLVLPAAGESGKTTTVAGLVLRGFDYLTDEVAALSLDGRLDLTPFRKALAVDKGSWPLLPGLEPASRPVLTQWQVPPPVLADLGSGPPNLVVSPRYQRGAQTRLERVGAADGLVLLAQCAFGFDRAPHRLLPALADLARRVPVHVLHIGELQQALDLVEELLDRV